MKVSRMDVEMFKKKNGKQFLFRFILSMLEVIIKQQINQNTAKKTT